MPFLSFPHGHPILFQLTVSCWHAQLICKRPPFIQALVELVPLRWLAGARYMAAPVQQSCDEAPAGGACDTQHGVGHSGPLCRRRHDRLPRLQGWSAPDAALRRCSKHRTCHCRAHNNTCTRVCGAMIWVAGAQVASCALPGKCCSRCLLTGVMGTCAGEAAALLFSFPVPLPLMPGPLAAAPLASSQPDLGEATAAALARRSCRAASASGRDGLTGNARTGLVCCAASSGAADLTLSGCPAAAPVPAGGSLAVPLRARIWACPTAEATL